LLTRRIENPFLPASGLWLLGYYSEAHVNRTIAPNRGTQLTKGLRTRKEKIMATIHNTPTFTTPTSGMRRFAHASLLVVAFAIGASAFGHTAIANAEWDIEAYDKCMAMPHVEEPHHPYHADCCVASGGVVDGEGGCRAPVDLTAVQGTPLGPKLGQPGRQPIPPITTLGSPVS
jgi:hypothetical protein